ncbi:MAG: glycosyltransferase family 9 protein [Ignavibacteriaceae bacterium]|nr:glycosyltransferase family 9 protein [Ignavibacteriaceae bacterium]
MNSEPQNILIVRTDRIGDLVLTLPMASALRKKYPAARISFLVRAYTADLLKGHPFIDEVILLAEKNGRPDTASNSKTLRSRKFDTAIAVSPDLRVAIMLFWAGIPVRIGTGYRWYSFLFNERIFEHRKTAAKHEAEYNFGLLRPLGITEPLTEESADYSVKIDREALSAVTGLLKDHGVKSPFIIVHPGSGGSAVDLPADKMKSLVRLFAEKTDLGIVLTGSEKEVNLCSELEVHGRTCSLAGKLSLPELTALSSLSSLFIANSTGPIHIAASLGTPTAGFYPKITVCSPRRWRPYSAGSLVFTPQLDCSNCTREQCEKLDCMNTIDISYVFNEITTKLLKNRS